MSDQGPPPSDVEPARPARPVKKVAKKRPAGSKASSTRASGSRPPKASGSTPPINDAQATTRGAIVIAVTVVVGLLIFWQGFSHETAETVETGTSPTTVEGDRDAAPTTTTPANTTPTTNTPVTKIPPAEISIIVANAVDGAQTIAGPKAQELTAAGYPNPVTMDLPPFGQTPTSSVYYTGDMESEAQAIAVVLGLPDSAVNPIPTPAPTPMNNAEILVIIGDDGI